LARANRLRDGFDDRFHAQHPGGPPLEPEETPVI
jgi:hypothetical protein